MNAIILTEGGREIGFGHITRCIALAQAMKRRGIKVNFFINADKSAEAILNKEKMKYTVSDWTTDKMKALLSAGQKDLIIIDSYLAQPDFYDFIDTSKLRRRIAVIDDYNRIDYNADILINPSISGDKIKYEKRYNSIYLVGRNYIILRKEFWKIPAKRVKRKIMDVLITLGGTGRHGFLVKMLRHLRMIFPHYTYHVVTPSRIGIPAGTGIRRYSDLSANRMKDLMLKTDIAISGGGQTLYELARLGVPTIGIRFSENQTVNMEGLHKEGFLGKVFYYKDKRLLNNIVSEVTSLQSEGARRNKTRIGRKLVDGQGADRVAKNLAELKDAHQKLYLRPANMNDCNDILSWRNHKEVRKWCFNGKVICDEEHKKWFADTIKSRNRKIYIAVDDAGESIGQVRINMNDSKRALINVNLNPMFFGKGFGSKVISMGTNLLLKENPEVKNVIAEIISTNIASKKAFQRAGYILSRYSIERNKHIAVFEYGGSR